MLLKQKRFVNSKLDKIVELYKKEKDGKLTIEEAGFLKSLRIVTQNSISKAIEGHMSKKYDKAYQKYDDRFSELDKMFDNKEISQEKYDKKIENAEYKLAKAEYVLNLEGADEKPKNPVVQRAVENVKKGAKAIGKGLVGTAAVIGGAVAFPFLMGYRGIKALENKVKGLYNGGKVALLTTGKVVKSTVGPTVNKVKETVKDVKENVQDTKIKVKKEIYDNSSEKAQKEITNSDWNAALKEDAKREREAERRKSLHMNSEEQRINHEEAIKKSEEKSGEEKESEQIENN